MEVGCCYGSRSYGGLALATINGRKQQGSLLEMIGKLDSECLHSMLGEGWQRAGWMRSERAPVMILRDGFPVKRGADSQGPFSQSQY